MLAPVNTSLINVALEDRMQLAQDICSLVLSLRKKVNIRVRQPLQKILLPALEPGFKEKVMAVQSLILTEVNVKQLEFIDDDSGIITKKAKPNFKQLGKKAGPHMKALTTVIENFTQQDIAQFEKQNRLNVVVNDMPFVLEQDDLQILSEDVAGWQVARQNQITVALDVNITPELMHEGIARELVNRIQNLRKEKGYEVTDKITVEVLKHPVISVSVTENKKYICAEILATSLELVDELNPSESAAIEVDETLKTQININKL